MARTHLVLLIHGLYGNPGNLGVLKDELEAAHRQSRGEDRHRRKGKGKEEELELEEHQNEDDPLLGGTSATSSIVSASSSRLSNTGAAVDLGDLSSGAMGGDSDAVGLKVLVAKSFCGSHTWDGIDVNAQRAAKEVSGMYFCGVDSLVRYVGDRESSDEPRRR
jgi:hypothetical protein